MIGKAWVTLKIRHKKVNRSIGGDIVLFFLLGIFALLMTLPMVYAISSSIKPLSELWIFPPKFFVTNPTLRNYKDLFSLLSDSWVPFSRYVFNTLLVAVVGTLGHVVIASLCAYAISKHRFYGSGVMFNIIVMSLMFTTAVTSVPQYLIMSALGLVNTYWALILPAFASSLGLFLMKQFMDAMVPDAVLEAARIDGAGEMRTIFTVVLPMVKPAWLTLMVLSFNQLWNISGGIFIQSEDLKTLNYVISQIVAGGFARAGTSSAAIVFMMALPILVFMLTQSSQVETMASSGIKE